MSRTSLNFAKIQNVVVREQTNAVCIGKKDKRTIIQSQTRLENGFPILIKIVELSKLQVKNSHSFRKENSTILKN